MFVFGVHASCRRLQKENKEIVELLLANRVDVTAKDNTGRAPADKAARRGHNDVVFLLSQRETKE